MARDEVDVVHPDAIVARIAAAQHGVVAWRQLAAAGLSRRAVEHRVARGRLHRVHRGVFLVGHAAPAPLAGEAAAILAYGPGAALSHGTAAYLHALVPTPPAEVHVLVACRSPRGRTGVRPHAVGGVAPGDLARRDGLPVTAPIRTLLDLAAEATERDLKTATNEIQVTRQATHATLVAAVAAARGRRGITRLRRLLDEHAGPSLTRSEAETRFLALVGKAGLPEPLLNTRIAGHEVDACWPDRRLIVEIDGFAFHSTRAAFERDRQRDVDLQLLGYTVLRITWRSLVERPEAVVAQLASALALP